MLPQRLVKSQDINKQHLNLKFFCWRRETVARNAVDHKTKNKIASFGKLRTKTAKAA